MKYLLKKYWILLLIGILISSPIFVLGVSRTDQAIILPGDTSLIQGLVEIDDEYEIEGSYSSIFVISMEHATKLQVLIANMYSKAYVYDMADTSLHFTNSELSQMGKIQFESSVQTSILMAYLEASKFDSSINIDYTNKSICVSYYTENSPFRIGDEIIEINGISINTQFEAFREAINNRKIGDELKLIRNNEEMMIVLDEDSLYSFGGYRYFDINYDTLFPHLTVNKMNVGGPSGGLLQTLYIFDKITSEDFSKGYKIAGTGTISVDGKVGEIGGIEQKIYTAFADKVDIFFCPEENYEDALKAYNKLENKERLALVMVKTFEDAISYLNQCQTLK